jgi:hypothetical protein
MVIGFAGQRRHEGFFRQGPGRVKVARRVGLGMLVARNSRENDTTDVLTAPATDQDRQAGALVVERPGNLTPGDALPTPCGGGRPSRS